LNKRVALAELSPLIKEVLENGNEVIITVTGNSMAPFLRHQRDKVCLVKTGGKLLKKYDLPLYLRADGKYILHRIIEIKKNGYVTAGDQQWVKEYPVLPSQVVAVAKGFWRKGKYISCNSFLYRVYCRFWVALFPLRRFYFKGKQLWTKVKRVNQN
jgi:hypothetical protein